MSDPTPVISRQAAGSTSHNTVNTRNVDVYFQTSPQLPGGGAARGIQDLHWRVVSSGATIASGTTPADGKVTVPIRNGQPSTLQLMVGTAAVASYTISEFSGALEAVSTLRGRQRRLRAMGYQLGDGGVDGSFGRYMDRAILEFQGDQATDMTGVVNAAMQSQLTTQAGF